MQLAFPITSPGKMASTVIVAYGNSLGYRNTVITVIVLLLSLSSSVCSPLPGAFCSFIHIFDLFVYLLGSFVLLI